MSIPSSLQRSLDETKVEYAQLGTSGLHVSVPILGTMSMGDKRWQESVMEEADSLQFLKAAWERGKIILNDRRIWLKFAGLSTWDTANVYSSGVNEEIVGKAIKKFNIPREKLTILGKVMGTVPESPEIFNWMFENQMKRSKDYVNKGGELSSPIPCFEETSLLHCRPVARGYLEGCRCITEASGHGIHRSAANS